MLSFFKNFFKSLLLFIFSFETWDTFSFWVFGCWLLVFCFRFSVFYNMIYSHEEHVINSLLGQLWEGRVKKKNIVQGYYDERWNDERRAMNDFNVQMSFVGWNYAKSYGFCIIWPLDVNIMQISRVHEQCTPNVSWTTKPIWASKSNTYVVLVRTLSSFLKNQELFFL